MDTYDASSKYIGCLLHHLLYISHRPTLNVRLRHWWCLTIFSTWKLNDSSPNVDGDDLQWLQRVHRVSLRQSLVRSQSRTSSASASATEITDGLSALLTTGRTFSIAFPKLTRRKTQ